MKKLVLIIFVLLVFSDKMALAYEYTTYLSLSLSEAYNDNVLLTGDRISDFITFITPGIDLSLKSGNSELKLGYSPSFSFYSSHDELNETAHHFTADGNFILSDKLSFTLRDTYLQSSEASDVRTIPDLGPITERTELRFHNLFGDVIYKVRDNLSYLLGASYSNTDYRETGLVEVKTYAGHMGLDFRYSQRTTFSADLRYAKYDYRPLSDYTIQNYTLGVTYMFTPTLTVEVMGGLEFTETEDTGESDTGFSGRTELTKRFEKGEAILSYTQAVIAGVQSEEPIREKIISLLITRPITEKWTASLVTSYSDYKSVRTNNFDADQVLFDAGLAYNFRPWANLTLSYSYVDYDDKNINILDYYNNIILLTFNLSYSMRH